MCSRHPEAGAGHPGDTHDYRIKLTLETGISAATEEEAKQHVLATIAPEHRPATIELGPAGAVLPFDIVGVKAVRIDWSQEPRP